MNTHPWTFWPIRLGVVSLVSIVGVVFLATGACAQEPADREHPLIVPSQPVRFGDRSLEGTIRTDERFGHDGLFQGPRGWVY